MLKLVRFAKYILCVVIMAGAVVPVNAQADSATKLANFLFPSFTGSTIKLKSGGTKTAVINYNIVDEEMVFLQDGNYMVLENPQQIDTVYVGSRRFIPSSKGFYEVISAGPVSLFIQHKSIAEPVGTPTGYGATSQTSAAIYQRQIYGPTGSVNLKLPDNFKLTDETRYWVKKGDMQEKFTTKRQFLKIFKDKEKELGNFIDSNSISFKSLSDIIKLINYCNELYG